MVRSLSDDEGACPSTLVCPVCAQDVPIAVAVGCARCGSPHHRDCWVFARSCSRFGCGGKRSIPFRRLPQDLIRGALEIDRNVAVPEVYQKHLAAGLRRLQMDELGRSLATGLKGGTAAMILALFWLPPLRYFAMFLGIGVIFGLLAPSLGPMQVRHPERMTAGSALALLIMFMAYASIPRPFPLLILPLVATIGVIAIIAGGSLAEWVLGRRQPMGIRLGRISVPLRYLVTGMGAGGAILISLWICMDHFPLRWILDTAPFVVAAIFAGGHPLEKAKELFEAEWDTPALPGGTIGPG